MYVAFEGIDTCGKSTQIKLLKQVFPNAIFTKEPGSTKFGANIKKLIFKSKISATAEMFLFLSDRAEHIEKTIKPNLNKLILSDRSFVSGVAYANGKIKDLVKLNRLATDNVLPDKFIFLKLSPQDLKARISQKTQDKIEKRGLEFLLQTQERIAKTLKILQIQTLSLNAALPKEKISQKIQNFIKKHK